VHVTLRRLRQELEAAGEPRLIQTVPRGGYVLRRSMNEPESSDERPPTATGDPA
jgi:DNA-binding winged helix-turn-helix (wHTH) protein